MCTTDGDGDGYGQFLGPGCAALRDCDDFHVNINPAELENLATLEDDNCNGRTGMLATFGEANFSTAQWTDVGPVSHLLDRISLGANPSSVTASSTRTLSMPLNTAVVVAMDVVSNTGTGAACEVRLGWGPASDPFLVFWTAMPIGPAGTQIVSFAGSLDPGKVLRRVQLACYGDRQLSVDWLQVQDAELYFPPPKDMSFDWQDTRHPVGGANTTLARDDGNGTLYMGSDVAGVGRRIPGQGWRVANGAGADSLMAAGMLGVGDILPMEDASGEVYLLSGDAGEIVEGDAGVNSGIVGGFWYSADQGDHWEQLGSSLYEWPPVLDLTDYGDHADDVAGYPLETNCTGAHFGHAWSSAGGRSLAADSIPSASGDVIYIANTDKDAMGVSIWDGGDVCALPNDGDPLPADRIGAILRVDAEPNGTPTLVVGYRGRWDGAASVYVCALPAARLDCLDPSITATCQEIGGDLLGADVRDLEFDTWLDDTVQFPQDAGVLLVDGGNRPTDTNLDGIEDESCNADLSGVAELFISDASGVGVLDFVVVPDVAIAADFVDVSLGYSITGLSLDPDSDFVFVNVPITAGSVYSFDRMHRIPAPDLLAVPGVPSAAWEAVNSGSLTALAPEVEDPYEAVRTNYDLDLSGAWPEAVFNGRADPFPSRAAPGQGYDTLWIPHPFAESDAVIAAGSQVWFTHGLTSAWTNNEGDADALSQPEGDVTFKFWPNIDDDEHQTYQSTVVLEARIARDGHIWAANMDQALSHLDATLVSTSSTPYGAEIDCLWHGWHAGASSVSIVERADPEPIGGGGPDPVVWATLLAQGDGANPQYMGVVRTMDNGATWQYAAAGWDAFNANSSMWNAAVSVSDDPATYGYRMCMDEDAGHTAQPFTVTTGVMSPAHAFSTEGSDADAARMINATTGYSTSIGNPVEVRALNDRAALVLFQAPTGAGAPGSGGFYLTVDGGGTWTRLTYNGGAGACDESTVYSKASFEFIHPGTDSRWEGDPLDANLLGELNLDILISVDDTGAATSRCSLARVQVQSTPATGTATSWSWYTLPFTTSDQFDTAVSACGVNNATLVGAIPAPWSNTAMLHGTYDRGFASDSIRHAYGGACLMDLDTVDLTTGGLTMVLDPRKYAAGISIVAPHPQVADVWAVLPDLGAGTYVECSTLPLTNFHPSTITGLDCPFPYPMILQGDANGFSLTTMGTSYPSTKPLTAAWSELDVMDDSADGYGSWLVVGTGGSGTWRGEMTW